MKPLIPFFVLAAFAGAFAQNPPYHGTIFDWPEAFTDDDPSAFENTDYKGQEIRRMYDRRNGEIHPNAHVFTTTFSDGISWDILVNPEFSQAEAAELAEYYGFKLGQMPAILRKGLTGGTHINGGDNPWAGGGTSVTVHTGQGESYKRTGIITQTLIHEATHSVIDRMWYNDQWQTAAGADGNFISTYARDNPKWEDHSETFLAWITVRFRQDRISQTHYDNITETVPNRLAFYDGQDIDMFPITGEVSVSADNQAIKRSNPFLKSSIMADRNTPVSIRILDLKGRTIRTFSDVNIAQGDNEVLWLGNVQTGLRMPGGMYLYRKKPVGY